MISSSAVRKRITRTYSRSNRFTGCSFAVSQPIHDPSAGWGKESVEEFRLVIENADNSPNVVPEFVSSIGPRKWLFWSYLANSSYVHLIIASVGDIVSSEPEEEVIKQKIMMRLDNHADSDVRAELVATKHLALILETDSKTDCDANSTIDYVFTAFDDLFEQAQFNVVDTLLNKLTKEVSTLSVDLLVSIMTITRPVSDRDARMQFRTRAIEQLYIKAPNEHELISRL